MDEKSYADLVALCQFLPGPASSQVGIGIGVMRAGVLGGIISFLGFTLPSVIALILFALILQRLDIMRCRLDTWIENSRSCCCCPCHFRYGTKTDSGFKKKSNRLVCISWYSFVANCFYSSGSHYDFCIFWISFYKQVQISMCKMNFPISRLFGSICLSLFFGLLIFLPILAN